MKVLKSDYKYRHSYKKILCKKGVDKKAEMDKLLPPPDFLQINGYLRCRLTKNSPRHIKSGTDAAGSKQHNFFTNNQLSHKTRKKIFRFIYQNVLFGLGQFNPINKINSLHIGTHVVSKGVSPLAVREKEGVIGGEKTLL